MADDKTWDFKTQLNQAEKHELEFTKIYKKHKLTKSADRRWDFNTPRGLRVELKCDTYDATKTPYFFLERYSDMYKKSPGGIWQSVGHDVDIFIYWFVNSGVYYEFRNLQDLIKVLEKLTENLYMIGIRNRGYITGGYKLTRDLLHPYFTRVTY